MRRLSYLEGFSYSRRFVNFINEAKSNVAYVKIGLFGASAVYHIREGASLVNHIVFHLDVREVVFLARAKLNGDFIRGIEGIDNDRATLALNDGRGEIIGYFRIVDKRYHTVVKKPYRARALKAVFKKQRVGANRFRLTEKQNAGMKRIDAYICKGGVFHFRVKCVKHRPCLEFIVA